ncbi:von Willebrand factor A domain-containing protein 5A-like [Siniperca chuatsi]|uniref:von Willebrand factor A domain-containing protein 5A-like n=1 Tax=Siniperca chuatsi TaxID=119488 RepID=UPI001CE2195E|nr:von Willebrand factor A domain-containing protein 5A-like [Siniperca chuatsi]
MKLLDQDSNCKRKLHSPGALLYLNQGVPGSVTFTFLSVSIWISSSCFINLQVVSTYLQKGTAVKLTDTGTSALRGNMANCCGLLTAQKEPVPLKSVEVELEVRDHVATVVSTLNYENKEDKPLETVFVFPLPGDAAVCHFSAKIGQTQIVAEVKEKQEARQKYDDALSSGQQAFLLEESEQSPDIFSLSVGSLPPGESASIRLEYVTELAVQADDGLRFCLPAVLNPRYQPQGSGGSGGGSVQVTSVPASLVPYSLSFSARVSSPHPISKVESHCSLDPLQYLNTEQTQATVKLAAGHKFDRDVELLIYYKDAHQPTAVVEAGQASAKPGTLMGDPVVMLSLYPEFSQAVMSSVSSCGEFVFLLDRSGSMDCATNNSKQQETRIGSARDTLLLLLKSLPMGCYFNIYSFGSSYEHIFSKSVEYSQKTLEEALKKVEQMGADLGGTEILEPLKHIYSQSCIPSQPRQLFVFTDGEVGNTKEVINLVKKNSGSHRCFSFGIGEGASSALINGLAKEGGGHAQFVTGTDRMQPKVRHHNHIYKNLNNTFGQKTSSGVSSSFTAFIAVNKGDGEAIQGPLVRRDVPTPMCRGMMITPCCLMASAVPDIAACDYNLIMENDLENVLGLCEEHEEAWSDNDLFAGEDQIAMPKQPRRDPLLQLVSLQKASGCWVLDPALAAALGKTSEEVENTKPSAVNQEVWATILALIWLHGFKMDAQEEWELLAMKAVSWLCAQNAPCVTECVEAGNALLGCNVQKDALGL